MGLVVQRADIPPEPHYLQQDELYAATLSAVEPFTMTSYERMASLIDATRYVVRAGIVGSIVECGVWRGGSMMAVARTLLEEGELRDLYLFDTYTGMTAPTAHDVDYQGAPAQEQYDETARDDHTAWCFASLEDVRRNLLSTGYPEERMHFIQGDVLQTIPHEPVGDIALLRLDTDWYESTLHEMKHLYPAIRTGGILIIDDFGYWQGCRKAVEEYFGRRGPFLSVIDQSSRLVVKPAPA